MEAVVGEGVGASPDRISNEAGDEDGTASSDSNAGPEQAAEAAEPGGAQNEARNFELIDSIRNADVEALNDALRGGADPNWLDPATGMSALHLAVLDGNQRAVTILIGQGADPNIESTDGKTAYEYAEENELTEILTVLETSPAGRR